MHCSDKLFKMTSALGCPRCHSKMPDSKTLLCACGYRGSALHPRVPLLTPRPEISLAQTLAQLTAELEALQEQIPVFDHRKATLKKLFGTVPSPKTELTQLLPDQLPSLTEYSTNVLRDWSWKTAEWDTVLTRIKPHLPKGSTPKTIAILGSGAGRVALEFSEIYPEAQVLAIDLNPFLTLFADQILHDQAELTWSTFHPNAMDDESKIDEAVCSLQKISKTKPVSARNITFVLGDALSPPLATRSVDLLVLPWVLDVLPMPIEQLIPHLNAALSNQGHLLFYGPLAFSHISNPMRRPTRQSLMQSLTQFGFDVLESDLHWESPLLPPQKVTRKREEQVLYLSAQKSTHHDWNKGAANQDWWLRPVPMNEEVAARALKHLTTYDILKQVDGTKTPEQLATLLSHYKKMTLEQARAVIDLVLNGA